MRNSRSSLSSGGDHLQRDLALHLRMACAVHHAHRTAPRDSENLMIANVCSNHELVHRWCVRTSRRRLAQRPDRSVVAPSRSSDGYERYDERHDDRRGHVRRGRGAPPARAARALLPDARLVRRGRGRAAGGPAAGVARPRHALAERRASCAPGCTRSPPTSAWMHCAAGQAPGAGPAVDGRGAVVAAVPGPAAGRGRADRGAARRRRGRARDDRADVHRADPAAARAPARGRDPARRARLVGGRDRRRCWTSASPRPTARCSAGARRCATSCRSARRSAACPPTCSPRTSSGCSRASSPPTRPATPRRRAALMREDIRITMPPHPMVFDGRDAIAPLLERAFGPERDGRVAPRRRRARTGMPAAASYLRQPGEHRVARVQVRHPALRGRRRSPRSRRSTRRCSSSSACRACSSER